MKDHGKNCIVTNIYQNKLRYVTNIRKQIPLRVQSKLNGNKEEKKKIVLCAVMFIINFDHEKCNGHCYCLAVYTLKHQKEAVLSTL